MKTLDEHNQEVNEAIFSNERPKAGVACPDCKTEMIFPDCITLDSFPPRRNVECPCCGYSGTKIFLSHPGKGGIR